MAPSLTDLVKQMLAIIAQDPSQQDALRGIAQQAQAGLKGAISKPPRAISKTCAA